MILYTLREKSSGLYIMYSANKEKGLETFGAYTPRLDGNYYDHPIILWGDLTSKLQYTMSSVEWWEHRKHSIKKGWSMIDPDFSFDPEDVEFVKFMED